MKKIWLILFLFFFWISFSYWEDTTNSSSSLCVLETYEEKWLVNNSLKEFEQTLNKVLLEAEKNYIWNSITKQKVFSCNYNKLITSFNKVWTSLKLVDYYIQKKDHTNFQKYVPILKTDIQNFVTLYLDYKTLKKTYIKLEQSKIEKQVTTTKDYLVSDSNEKFSTVDQNADSTDSIFTVATNWEIFKNFYYDWADFEKGDYYLKTDSNWKISYYLVDTLDEVNLLLEQKGIIDQNKFVYYISTLKKYWVINLLDYPLTPVPDFNEIEQLFLWWKVIDTINWNRIENLNEIILSELTLDWKKYILGNQLSQAFSFESEDELISYFQEYLSTEKLKNYLLIQVGLKYYVTKVEILDKEKIKVLSNHLIWSDNYKDFFNTLESFKFEFYDILKFSYYDTNNDEVIIERNSILDNIDWLLIPYLDNSTSFSYELSLKNYLEKYTSISFWDSITLYYNKLDNQKEFLKEKLKEYRTYDYLISQINNQDITEWVFWTNLTGNDLIIFKTYKWIVENINYDSSARDEILNSLNTSNSSTLKSLSQDKSHLWLYTLTRKLWVCDWISILFSELLKLQWVDSEIVTWRDNKSGIWHALVKIGSTYYDPTNEISRLDVYNTSRLVKDTEAFYNLSKINLDVYFTEILTSEDSKNFVTSSDSKIRTKIEENLKTILTSNPSFIYYFLWTEDNLLTENTNLTNVTTWETEFDKDISNTIYKSDNFERINSKVKWESYLSSDLNKSETIKVYFLEAYLNWYKYYYYNTVTNQLYFYLTRW